MGEITYRFLTKTDASAFREFRLKSFKQEPPAFFFTREEKENAPLSYWENILETEYMIGAFEGNLLMGCGSLRVEDGVKICHRAYLGSVYVAAEARGKGIARVMMERLLEKAKLLGIEIVRLSTKMDNPVSVGLYKNLGFEEYGIEKHFLKLEDGTYVDEVLMIKFI